MVGVQAFGSHGHQGTERVCLDDLVQGLAAVDREVGWYVHTEV